MGEEIGPNTVLPARREPITLHTPDGLALVGELALPADRDPVATMIACHPLPTHGGMMDSHVLRKAAARLPELAGIAVLRFNTRGTASVQGRSEGTFSGGEEERHDLAAAIDFVDVLGLPSPWLVGWSFGTDLVLRHGCDPSVVGAVLLSPPLRWSTPADLDTWAASGKPMLVLVPELDDFLRPAEAVARFARVPQAEVRGVAGARHLWVGETYVRLVLDAIVSRLAPDVPRPLPTRWPVG
jgi:hypothetical protein